MSAYTTFQEDTNNTSTTANFTGLDNGKYYQFRVSAVNSEGSGVVAVSDKALLSGPPNAVTSLTPTVGAGSVSLSWTKPSSSGGKLITGYEIKYLLVDQTVSDALASVSVTERNGECAVSWVAPTNFGYSDITGYKVEYAVSPYNTWDEAVASINALTYTVTDLTNGTGYKFRVSVINGIGTSSSTESSIATPQAVPPDAPISLTVSAGNQQFTGSWTAPTNNGGAPITGYRVEYAADPYSSWIEAVASNTSTSYTVLSLTNGTNYQFRVTAINSQGAGSASTPSSVVTPSLILPSAPTNLSGVLGDVKVSLTWTAPGLNGGPAITDYKIEYKVSTDSWPATPLYVLAGDTDTSEDVTGLTNGTAYNFRVYAKTTNGFGPASSETGDITPALILPSAPTNVSGAGENVKVSLSWTAPGLNGGPAITDYKIEYKVSTDSWPATPLYILAGDTDTSEDVTGLTNGTAYNFRVYAKTTNGFGPASSETDDITPTAFGISSTGGIVTTYTSNSINYTVYEFRYTGGTSGTQTTYTFTVSGSKAAEVFIVGGGGCGGSDGGGGGGGGGVVYDPNITLGAGDYTVKVGNGGDINTNTSIFGEKGSDSEITTVPTTAITKNVSSLKGNGGGAGYPRNKDGATEPGADGGSGGGADHSGGTPRPAGDSNQGNTYWNGSSWVAGGHSGGVAYKGGAGGGGAGGDAPDQTSNSSNNGSAGGPGVDNNWLGDDNGNNKGTGWRNYAAGGGGGHWQGVGGAGGQSASNSSTSTKGSGGGGRGGNGNPTSPYVSGNSHNSVHGKEHRGGGGGGEGYNGRGDEGQGGSGIVLIRYVT